MLHIPNSKLEHSSSNSKLLQDCKEEGVQANNIILEPYLRWCCRTCLLHQNQPRLCRKHLQRRSCYLEAFHLHPDELHHLVRCSPGIGIRPCGWNYPVCCWLVSWINSNLCMQDLSVLGCSLPAQKLLQKRMANRYFRGTTSSGGSSLPTNLLKVDVPVVSRTSCQASYGTSAVTTQMFCAGLSQGGKDSCQGDSGGPIINKATKVLLGAVSWGDGCALPNAPGVYANIGQATLRSFVAANL
jgi:hypothetical protein